MNCIGAAPRSLDEAVAILNACGGPAWQEQLVYGLAAVAAALVVVSLLAFTVRLGRA